MKNYYLLFLLLCSYTTRAQLTLDWKLSEGNANTESCNSLSLTSQGALLRAITFASATAAEEARFSRLPQNGLANTTVDFSGPSTDEGIRSLYNHAGKVYNAGHFRGTIDFNPSPFIISNATSGFARGIFIVSLDTFSIPAYQWVQSIVPANASSSVVLNDMAVDMNGNFYLIGNMTGTVTFNGGGGSKVAAVNGDIFFAKYSNTGSCLWVKQLPCTGFPGMGNYISGNAITVADNGSVFIAGRLATSSIDIDPNAGVVTPFGANGDIFVGKYTGDGSYTGHLRLSSSVNINEVYDIELNGMNIYLTGKYGWNNLDFDPGAGSAILDDGSFNGNMFVAAYDTSFNYLWAKGCSGANTEYGYRLSSDNSGNVYVAGEFSGTADLNPGGSPLSVTSQGGLDIMLIKYDAAGNLVWGYRLGGTSNDYGNGIAATPSGDALYLAGQYMATVNFDLQGGNQSNTAVGSTDIFLLKYTQSVPLPVHMGPLSARPGANVDIELNWESFRELGNDGFQVERSFTGGDFEALCTVPSKAKGGYSNQPLAYSCLDKHVMPGTVYYRVREQGSQTVSNIVQLYIREKENTPVVHPNPASDQLMITHTGAGNMITIRGMNACICYSRAATEGHTIIDVSSLLPGIYLIDIETSGGHYTSKLLIRR